MVQARMIAKSIKNEYNIKAITYFAQEDAKARGEMMAVLDKEANALVASRGSGVRGYFTELKTIFKVDAHRKIFIINGAFKAQLPYRG